MSVKLSGFEFITGVIVSRPWGFEYRFTAKAPDGKMYDDVVPLSSGKETENTIAGIINARLAITSAIATKPSEQILSKSDVEAYLRDTGVISNTQTIDDIKTTMSKTIAGKV